MWDTGSFFPLIRKIIVSRPRLAAVGGRLAELTHLVRSLVEKCKSPVDLLTTRICGFISEMHRTISIFPVDKFLYPTGVRARPRLFPFIRHRIDEIDAFTRTIRTVPIFQKCAAPGNHLYEAVTDDV